MPIAIICDDSISMIMKSFEGEKLIETAEKFLKKFLESIEAPYLHYIALFRRNDQLGTLLSFRKDYQLILEQFTEIRTNIRSKVHGDFRYFDAVKYCDDELKKLWGCDYPNQIIVLSDGGKVFSGYKEDADQYTLNDNFRSIVHTISFTDRMNEGLRSLSEQTGGACIFVKNDWKCILNSNDVIEKIWKAFKDQAVHIWYSEAHISFGHLKADVKLFPFMDLSYSSNKKYCYEYNDNVDRLNLTIDIYGVLSLVDLNYPCSSSDHLLIFENNEQKEGDETNSPFAFIQLLNTGLLETKTAAICCVRYKNDSYVRYGFVRNLLVGENKYSLKLCLFPKDYAGLPWIGKFTDLNPSSDFPDIYNSPEAKSPFPVKIKGDCSYKTNNDDSYQYTTWVSSSNTLVNDFSKIVRICKRLPERKLIFYKEINRFRETALTIGSRGLLTQLCSMLQKESVTITNIDAQAVLRYVLESLTNNPHNVLLDIK